MDGGSIRLGGIGSCRIYRPLKTLKGKAPLEPTVLLGGHIHNPLEMLQLMQIRHGKRELRKDISKLLNINLPDRMAMSLAANRFAEEAEMDIVVVEISSLRIIEYDGWFLQINAFRTALAEAGLSANEIKQAAGAEKREFDSWADDCPPLLKQVVAGLTAWEMTHDEILSSLDALKEEIDRPIVLVGFSENDANGQSIPQRRIINAALQAFAADRDDVEFFDPTALVEETGWATAMKDSSHYNPPFDTVAGDMVGRSAIALADRLSRQRQHA